jgi:hypothetical protein
VCVLKQANNGRQASSEPNRIEVSKPSGEYPKVSQNLPENRGGRAPRINHALGTADAPGIRDTQALQSARPLRARRQVAARPLALRYKLEFGTEESSALLGVRVPSSYAQ